MGVVMGVWTALLGAGCGMGPNAATVVDELRVLAIVADTPEARPGESVPLQHLVLDPQERGFDVLSWTCTFTGEACLEAGGAAVWDGLVVARGAAGPWLDLSLIHI